MALRSIGSSLVGKAQTGSPLRKTTEQGVETPQVPQKGVPGSIEREAVQQPFERAVPPGSQKVVSVAPTADVTAVSSPAAETPTSPEQAALLAGIGNGNVPGAATPGANNQPLFQGGIAPETPRPGQPAVSNAPAARAAAAPAAARGRTPTYSSGAGRDLPIPESGLGLTGEESRAQAERYTPERESLPSVVASLGGRAVAGEENRPVQTNPGFLNTGLFVQPQTGRVTSFTPTTGQTIAGGVGKVISNVGNAIKSPAISNVGNKLQTYGGAVQPAAQSQGSLTSALRSIVQRANPVNQLRSVVQAYTPVVNTVRSAAQNVASKISSLFKRK